MDDNIHPDLEGIIEGASEALAKATLAATLSNYREIEQHLFESRGNPDTEAEIWLMKIEADTVEKARTYLETQDNEPINKLSGDGDGLLSLALVASGDVYEGLNNRRLSFDVSLNSKGHGVAVRAGAWKAPALEGMRASEHPDREEGVLTMFVSMDGIVVVSRTLTESDDKVAVEHTPIENYEMGESKLVDAIIKFWFGPRTLRDNSPVLFKAMLERLED